MTPLLLFNEHYVSIQGEGPRVGILTQFVRFNGCPFRCPSWPCDTPYAIFPHIWKNDPKIEVDQLFKMIVTKAEETGAKNICYTGGEPFMQKEEALETLTKKLLTETDYDIECFTNGAYEYPIWARHAIDMVMDWKLGGSGEQDHFREARIKNVYALPESSSLKFTIATKDDLQEAKHLTHEFLTNGMKMDIWAGIVFNKEVTNDELIEFIIANKLPWKFTMQTHKIIWDPEARAT